MEFEEISLDDLVKEYVDNRGKTCPIVDREDSYMPLIATNCITEDLHPQFTKVRYVDKETYSKWFRAHPKPNDIIFVNKGTPGGTALVPEKVNFCIAQDMVGLRIKEGYSTEFVFAALRSDLIKKRIESMQVGTMIPHFKKGDFKKLYISMPTDKKVQLAIGKLHLNLLKKIDLNKNITSILEEIAQTLFKRWFVDFEFPNENGEPYKSSGGEVVESELGMIPSGWEVSSLDQVATYTNGLAMQKFRPEDNDKSLPVLKIRELREERTDSNSDRCTNNIKDTVKINDGDIIFSWSATLLVKQWYGGKAGLNQHLFKVTSKDYPKWFYYYWTQFHLEQFIAHASDKATTMGHIKRSHLAEAKVLIPPRNVINKHSKLFSPILDLLLEKGLEKRKLEELRDTLLPKLLSGEIELPEETEVTEDVPIS